MEDDNLYKEYKTEERKKSPLTIVIAILLLFIVVGGMFTMGFYLGSGKYKVTENEKNMVKDLPLLSEIYGYINEYYYNDIPWDVLQLAASAGLAQGLDSFSGLALTEKNPVTKALGVTIVSNNYNEYFIKTIETNSPAKTAVSNVVYDSSMKIKENAENMPIHKGDELVKVMGLPVKHAKLEFLNSLIGSSETVKLLFLKTDGNYYEYVIAKQMIKQTYSDYQNLGDNVGYINLKIFDVGSDEEFAKSCYKFLNDQNANKLILDLRDNPGGRGDILCNILPFLIKDITKNTPYDLNVCELDTKKNKSIEKTNRMQYNLEIDGETKTINNTFLGDSKENFKLTILTNKGSASSAEVLVGAVKFYNGHNADISTVVGETTYGKGVGQFTFPVGNGEYLLYVTAGKYYLYRYDASGKVEKYNIHDIGLNPDYAVKDNQLVAELINEPVVQKAIEVLNAM